MVRKINSRWGIVRLPKIGELKFRLSRDLPTIPSSVTVTLEPDGTYHVSFVVDVVTSPFSPNNREAGLDLGLLDFAAVVYTDGTREKIVNPRHFRKAHTKLRKAQKDLSRKQKGSSNRKKGHVRVSKHHSAIRRRRLDFIHKLTSRLVNENQVIITEKLSVIGLARAGANGARGRGLRRSINDVGWGMFLTLLSTKAQNMGREHIQTDMFFPSTRLCSFCGTVNEKKNLSIRVWSCECTPNLVLDRDYNAAVNLLIAGGHSVYGEDIRRALASC